MEQLFRFIIALLSIVFSYSLQAQNSLCVYAIKGSITVERSGKYMTLKKGDIINTSDKVKIGEKSQITAIDNSGSTYLFSEPGRYDFKKLVTSNPQKNTSGLTSKYFRYIWQELTHQGENKIVGGVSRVVGGVYRGDGLMISPPDSAQVKNSKITFRWKNESLLNSYIFIRNKTTSEVLKIATNGSELTLFGDNPILSNTDTIEWTVSEESFPNLANVAFQTIYLISSEEFKKNKQNYLDFEIDLKNLDLDQGEIKSILCTQYKLCE